MASQSSSCSHCLLWRPTRANLLSIWINFPSGCLGGGCKPNPLSRNRLGIAHFTNEATASRCQTVKTQNTNAQIESLDSFLFSTRIHLCRRRFCLIFSTCSQEKLTARYILDGALCLSTTVLNSLILSIECFDCMKLRGSESIKKQSNVYPLVKISFFLFFSHKT